MVNSINNFPKQKLSFRQKTKKWRKEHLDWADKRTPMFNSHTRASIRNKKINGDLVNGILNPNDMKGILNPTGFEDIYIPKNIQHYPIINNPLNVLIGEESKRRFDYKIVVSNPNAISDLERSKMDTLSRRIEEDLKDESLSDEEFQERVKAHSEYINYEWQDIRELRANYLVNHYIKELDMKVQWNYGFENGLIYGEEIHQFDIVHNEPVHYLLNPRKIFTVGMGFSNRIEDADIVIIEDYWSVGKIIDTFHDQLTDKDITYIEDSINRGATDDMHNIDEREFFINRDQVSNDAIISQTTGPDGIINDFISFAGADGFSPGEYFDHQGNVRMLRVFWKSKRKVKKVKKYDPITGDEIYDFYPETYVINKDLGEEEDIMWINEAWEGIKIGKDVYVNMGPRKIQYNRLENPSKCHFGLIGSVYNINEDRPVSFIERLKPYQYLYDFIKSRLVEAISSNLGKIAELDLAKVPEGWDVKKWLWFIKKDKIAFVDSFKEGNKGRSTGKLAGSFNTTGRSLDLDFGNYIQHLTNLLAYIEEELNKISGVSQQRQGQISQNETVGGVERSVVQSSHITEKYFMIHDNVKKRCIECLLETAKIALKDSTKKIQYIADDTTSHLMTIPGDEFSECDYGVIVDNDSYSVAMEQKLEQLAHAALQNQTLRFSTIMAIFSDPSMSSIKRRIEKDERETMERQAQDAKAQNEALMQQSRETAEIELLKIQKDEEKNIRDNETSIRVAEINKSAKESSDDKKVASESQKRSEDNAIKREQIAAQRQRSNN